MPEGPEIRRAADKLAEVLVHQRIEEVYLGLPQLATARELILGETVREVTCHGKAMLIHFSSDHTLYSHNQLYGIWRITRRGKLPNTNRQLRVALHTPGHSALLYSATDVEFWETPRLHQHPFLSRLGPDVLDPELTDSRMFARLKDHRFCRRSLAALYLDQSFVAGIGNYLRSEILHAARVHPKRRPQDLTVNELRRLARQTLRVSRRSYETGGITNSKALAKRLKGRGGHYESYRFMVFNRLGQPCYSCDDAIEKAEVSSRRIYWCARCQPAG